MKTRESEEMYLETILLLHKQKASVHAIDVAGELGFSKPSVSRAVGLLEKNGYVLRNASGELTLTEAGMQKATDIYERHRVITALLVKTGANEQLAEENACRIEHVISAEMFEILKNYEKQGRD